jgi:hypothetical protein
MTRWLRLLLLPWHALAVLTRAKGFASPVIGSPALNRLGLHVWRTRAAAAMAARRRRRLAPLVSEADRAAFARDGFVERRDFLPTDVFAALRRDVAALPAASREMREGDAVTRHIALTPQVLARCPGLRALVEHPEFRGLTRYVAGSSAEPWIAVQTVLSHAVAGDDGPQTRLHMDTFHPNIKAWFFLHEVAEADGPLTYVPGSHLPTRRRLAWQRAESIRAARRGGGGAFRIPAAQLPRLRLPPARRFAVPGNTLVVGDMFGLRARGASLRPSVRVEVYAISRPSPFWPFALSPTDRLLPALRRRKFGLAWWVQDRLARAGLGPVKWRPAPRGAFDPMETSR